MKTNNGFVLFVWLKGKRRFLLDNKKPDRNVSESKINSLTMVGQLRV
jgi:hypothetical protein